MKKGKKGKSRNLRFERDEREAWEERFEYAVLKFEYRDLQLLRHVSGCCIRNNYSEKKFHE